MKKLIIILLFAATASASIFINSFNSGLISEEMKVRHDLDRTSMGSEVLDNILIRPQGMAYKRPGMEYIASSYGTYTDTIPAVPEVPATYNLTYISENGYIWGIPIGDGVINSLDSDDAVNIGGGVVGLPWTGHPFTIGESISITGTTNYEGLFTVGAGTTTNEIRITDTYVAETFDGTEVIVKYTDSLYAGAGNMVQDSSGNLYYGHIKRTDGNGYYYVTRIAPDGTQSPDYEWLNYPWSSSTGPIIRGLAIAPDDNILYMWIEVFSIIDYGYMLKFNLTTGNLIWVTSAVYDETANPGFDMAIDADGNGYAPTDFGHIRKFDSSDGAGSFLTLMGSPKAANIIGGLSYSVVVDDDMGIVVAGGRQFASTSYGYDENDFYNVAVRKFDNSEGYQVVVGNLYVDGPLTYTPVIGTGQIVTHGGYIYVLVESAEGYSTIYKYDAELNLSDSVSGPDYGRGLYFDLYDNLVVVNQEIVSGQSDVLYFYDEDLNYLSKIDNMRTTMLASWNATIGSAYIQGNAVFNGVLGTPEIPEIPGSWSYAGFDPGDRNNIRLLPFEYAVEDAYVLEFGHEFIGFLRTTR